METQIVTESVLYWITRLDGLVAIQIGIAVVLCGTAITIICIALANWDYGGWDKKVVEKLKYATLFAILTIVVSIGAVLTPTTKQMCAIKVIPMIINDEQVQELPSKVIDLADEWLDSFRPVKKNDN